MSTRLYTVTETAIGGWIVDGETGDRIPHQEVANMLNKNILRSDAAKTDALLEAVQTILSQAMYMTTINAFAVCISDLNELRYAYERIVPPKTTEQLLQERLDAADVLWERFGGEAVTSRGVEVINAYSNAKKAHEASKP